MAHERKLHQERMAKRAAEEVKHTTRHVPPPVGHMGHVGRKVPRWDDFVPPENLNARTGG
jgi:hypothetical protein